MNGPAANQQNLLNLLRLLVGTAGRDVRMSLADLRSRLSALALALLVGASLACTAVAQPGEESEELPLGLHGVKKLPQGVLLINGASASASDEREALPEGGKVGAGFYQNAYFNLHFSFPGAWIQQYDGPPPSDSGYYVLAQLQPPVFAARGNDESSRGTVLITARDLFFTSLPGTNVLELMRTTQASVQQVYKLEQPLAQTQLGGHAFVWLGYSAPQTGLRWLVFSTEIRCHLVQFVITSPDARFIDAARQALRGLQLPAHADVVSGTGGDDAPVCIADYTSGENLLSHIEPILPPGKANPIPVRIIIDTAGQVRHIHTLSAFPDQAQAITTALKQWRFRPHMLDGHPVEVETGILFGRRPLSQLSHMTPLSSKASSN